MKVINVFTTDNQLWTANLIDENGISSRLGGSYPKSRTTSIDATRTWGNYKIVVTLVELTKLPETLLSEA
jgi:hypothetical protein